MFAVEVDAIPAATLNLGLQGGTGGTLARVGFGLHVADLTEAAQWLSRPRWYRLLASLADGTGWLLVDGEGRELAAWSWTKPDGLACGLRIIGVFLSVGIRALWSRQAPRSFGPISSAQEGV